MVPQRDEISDAHLAAIRLGAQYFFLGFHKQKVHWYLLFFTGVCGKLVNTGNGHRLQRFKHYDVLYRLKKAPFPQPGDLRLLTVHIDHFEMDGMQALAPT